MDPLRAILNSNDKNREFFKSDFFRICLGITGMKEEARDLAQDSIIKALENISTFTGNDKDMMNWLTMIAKNTYIDSKRKKFYTFSEKIICKESGVIVYDKNGVQISNDIFKVIKQDLVVKIIDNETLVYGFKMYKGSTLNFLPETYITKGDLIGTKRKKIEKENLPGETPEVIVDDHANRILLSLDLEDCISKLDANEREIITLAQTHNYNVISKALDISERNVRVRVSRVRQKLAKCLGVLK